MLTVLGVILLVFALFLIVSVLMQHGKAKNISGAIAGGAETFFGKTKGSTIDKKLSKATTIVAIVFVVLVLVSYLLQGVNMGSNDNTIPSGTGTAVTETTEDTAAETTEDTAAAEESDAAAE